MKLLQINVTANSGSTGRIAEDIGEAAMAQGWESYIAYGQYENAGKSQHLRIGNDWSIKWHGVESRLFDRHGLASQSATKKLIRQIININPDIVHLHNIHGYYINYPLLFEYLRQSRKPVVWTLHDCWAFTGHCAHFVTADCMKWQNGCENCPLLRSYPKSIMFDRSKQNYVDKQKAFTSISDMTLVPVSKWLEGCLHKSFLQKYPSFVIHNGIDTKTFKPHEEKNGRFTIIGVSGVWDKSKGFDDFIKIAKMLSNDIKIKLVGINKHQKRMLPNNILGIEHTESIEKLSEMYSNADLFLNLTYADTFPTTNLEALACGTPVLTYDTGGSPEAITAETGFVVPQGDLKRVTEIILKVKRNGKSQYKKACRKWALDNFRKEDRYNDYLQLYNNIISKNHQLKEVKGGGKLTVIIQGLNSNEERRAA